jgi:broad specificity polyphosphatase/5'/3'-nucleotidase SurE
LDGNFTWNPLSGNTVVSSSDLVSGINSGANLSCDFPFSDGTSAHVSAELLSVTITATSTPGGTASGGELGYAHLTADTVNGKHFTADGHLTWNMLSGNTVTTASDLVSGFEPGGNISAVVTFEGGSSVHITAQFGAVTITQP